MNEAPDATFSSNLVDFARDRLDRLGDQVEKTLNAADVDSVHALRVASRRLNECLVVMQPWICRRGVRAARRGLRQLRDAFRKVRDLDVLQMSLSSPPPMLDAGKLAQLEGLLTRRRERELQSGLKDLKRAHPTSVVRNCRDLFREFRDEFDDAEQTLADRFTVLFRELADGLLAADPRHPEGGDLHETRIRVKRTRYCLELAQRIEIIPETGLAERLTELQDATGHWNDQLIAARWISRIATRRSALANETAWSRALLEYAAHRVAAAEEDRRLICERWPAIEAGIRSAPLYQSAEASPNPATAPAVTS